MERGRHQVISSFPPPCSCCRRHLAALPIIGRLPFFAYVLPQPYALILNGHCAPERVCEALLRNRLQIYRIKRGRERRTRMGRGCRRLGTLSRESKSCNDDDVHSCCSGIPQMCRNEEEEKSHFGCGPKPEKKRRRRSSRQTKQTSSGFLPLFPLFDQTRRSRKKPLPPESTTDRNRL